MIFRSNSLRAILQTLIDEEIKCAEFERLKSIWFEELQTALWIDSIARTVARLKEIAQKKDLTVKEFQPCLL